MKILFLLSSLLLSGCSFWHAPAEVNINPDNMNVNGHVCFKISNDYVCN